MGLIKHDMPVGFKKLKTLNTYGGIGVHLSYEGLNDLLNLTETMATFIVHCKTHDNQFLRSQGYYSEIDYIIKKLDGWK